MEPQSDLRRRRQREAMIFIRNTKIESVMRRKYRQITSDPKPLLIACVFSAEYNHHLQGYETDAIPISVKNTGIPSLRLSLSRFPAGSKLNVLRQYRNGILPDIISSMEMWSLKSATKRRNKLRLIAAKPKEVSIFLS